MALTVSRHKVCQMIYLVGILNASLGENYRNFNGLCPAD